MNRSTMRVVWLAATATLFVGGSRQSLADIPYPDVTSSLLGVQTGGPFLSPLPSGDTLWSTPVDYTNNGSVTLQNVTVIITSQVFLDPGTDALENTTWNNAGQQWQYSSTTLHSAHSSFVNASFYLSLAPTNTNIPIPTGFGLTTSDSVPAYSLGTLAPGQTVSVTFMQDISSNVTEEFFNGSIAGTAVTASVPEPSTLIVGSIGALALVAVRVRRPTKRSAVPFEGEARMLPTCL
jgi:PEP-CTERM motif